MRDMTGDEMSWPEWEGSRDFAGVTGAFPAFDDATVLLTVQG